MARKKRNCYVMAANTRLKSGGLKRICQCVGSDGRTRQAKMVNCVGTGRHCIKYGISNGRKVCRKYSKTR